MLNIERSLIEFINDERLDFYKFMPMNRYYRMFVHRIAEYFGLGHNLDQTKQYIIVKKQKKPGVSAQKESKTHLKTCLSKSHTLVCVYLRLILLNYLFYSSFRSN